MSDDTEPNVLEIVGLLTLTVLPIFGIAYFIENFIQPAIDGTFVISSYWQGIIDSVLIIVVIVVIIMLMGIGPRRRS